MARALNRQHTHTEIDLDTGEMNRIVEDEFKGYIDQEPDYIKIYVGTQLCLQKLDPNLAPYIIAFGPYMTYANDSQYTHMVHTDVTVRRGVARYLGVTDDRVKQIIKLLITNGIFIPIIDRVEQNGVITNKQRRGIYFVNPWVVAKGSWKDLKKLRQEIDFVKGSSSYYIEDELGERKVQVNLPNNYQFTLEVL